LSHVVTIQTKVHDPAAVAAACRRLALAEPVQGTARLYSAQVSGLLVHLPGWRYPAVLDTRTGTIHFDHFGGRWGEPAQLDRFLQAYAVEKTTQEARRKSYTIHEQQLPDGSIQVQLREGA
jgi:hypothetical protein